MHVHRSTSARLRLLIGALGVLTAAAVLAIAAIGSPSARAVSPRTSSGPIRLGSVLSTSGIAAPYGIPEQNAIQLAIDQYNAAGGIAGHKLVWTHYDAAADTATGISEARRLISENHIQVMIDGGTLTNVAIGINPVVTAAHLLFVSAEADPSLSNPQLHPGTFTTAISTQLVIDRMLQYLEQKHIKTVAILADSTAFSQDGLQLAQADASKYGVKIVVATTYDAAATDLTAQLTQAEQKNPGAYLNITETPTGAVFMKNVRALGLNKKAPIMETYTYSNPSQMELAGSAGDGVDVSASQLSVMTQLPSSSPTRTALEAFNKAYTAKFHQPISIYAAQAYDAASIALRAIKANNGNTNVSTLVSWIQSHPYPGLQGTYNFSKTNHTGLSINDVVMTEWNGKKFVLLP
jgi:branched-chain amino acid transport system substrate-binding protein